jgi:hypothetical protein
VVNRKLLSSKPKGFTLIELMLSTSLLMMVMFSGYYAYSLYSQKWQKRVDVFWQGTNQGVGLDALNKLFISTASYVIKNSEGKEGIYFSGDSTHLKFISNSPIFSSGSALIELVVQRIDNKDKLIYRENNLLKAPIYSLKDIESITEWQKEVVLFDNFNAISWSFYGWTSFVDALEQAELAENINKRELRKAYSLHDFGNIRVLPISIKLSLNNGSNQSLFSIDLPNNTVFTLIANLRNDA